jgi:hypothetical protein
MALREYAHVFVTDPWRKPIQLYHSDDSDPSAISTPKSLKARIPLGKFYAERLRENFDNVSADIDCSLSACIHKSSDR